MIPSWWEALVLALGLFRVLRLIGRDTFPPLVIARDWITGATWDEDDEQWSYRRPLAAELIGCPYCLSTWTAPMLYVWWLVSPASALYVSFPLALSGAVGLIAARLDP